MRQECAPTPPVRHPAARTQQRSMATLRERRHSGRHHVDRPRRPSAGRGRGGRLAIALTAVVLAVVIAAAVLVITGRRRPPAAPETTLPVTPASYLGVYARGAPQSFAGVRSFTSATGVRPNLVSYYSGWLEPFWTTFAVTAAQDQAVPLVQIDPTGISLAAIANGRYDRYLISYARSVRAYQRSVIISFGHEMNGDWYSWGYRHTSPSTFVAAWRHIVRVFRAAGARNVTWLWTINVELANNRKKLSPPALWFPGRSYVTWIGLDGYYYHQSSSFAEVFGPTVAAVRAITADPILISETAVAPSAGQPAKITDLFAGIRAYGLLGFIWFDTDVSKAGFRITSPAAVAAFRRAASAYRVRAF
jgi:mannan endo-1,4-beta-mannosidase